MTSPSTPAPRRPIETTVPGSGTAPPRSAGLVPFPESTATNSGVAAGLALTQIGVLDSLMELRKM